MVQITKNDSIVICDGHAENKVVCGMFTTLCVNLVKGCEEVLHIKPSYIIRSGFFCFDMSETDMTHDVQLLFDVWFNSVLQLVEDYPQSFVIRKI